MRRTDAEQDQIGVRSQLNVRHFDYAAGPIASFVPVVAVGAEVVPAAERSCSLFHRIDVEPVFHPPDKTLPECRAPGRYLVQIEALLGMMSCVETGRGLIDSAHANVGREPVVDLLSQHRGIDVT